MAKGTEKDGGGGVATADTWSERDIPASSGSAGGAGGEPPGGGGGILIEFKDRPKIDKTQNRPKIGQR